MEDDSCKEDDLNRIWNGNYAECLSMLNQLSLSLAQLNPSLLGIFYFVYFHEISPEFNVLVILTDCSAL